MKNSIIFQIAVFGLAVFVAHGAIPQAITYQGWLTDDTGSQVADGNYSLTFKIYDAASGGTNLWSETQPSVAVVGGLFKVQLGSVTPITAAFDAPYWLEVQVGSGLPQTPRIELSTVPYSFVAMDADHVDGFDANATPTANTLLPLDATGKFPESAIPSVPIDGTAGGDLTGTYPNPTIAANAVTSAKIAASAVNTSDIANAAVTQAKLDPSVTLPPGGAAGGDLTGTYPNPTIAANAVNSSKIQDGQVKTADIQNNAVTAAKIAPNVVSSVDGVSNDGGNIDLVAGTNITITPNDGANTITIAATPGGGGGDITGVGAGLGLTGGGSSGDVTLDVGAGTGIAISANAVGLSAGYADGSVHDGRFVNEGQSSSVTSGMIVDGTIQEADMAFAAGDITAVNAGTGLDGGGTTGSVTLNVEVPLALAGAITTMPLAVVKAENTTTYGPFHGVFGECASTDGFGVTGAATATSGETIGLNGYANSPAGYGVHGSGPGCGVYGEATATTAINGMGGHFKSLSSDGSGIYAENLHTSGNTNGVYGFAASTQGTGVYGYVPAGSGTTYGVCGVSNSTSGRGVYGGASSTSSSAHGVHGSGPGCGVYGEATATTAINGTGGRFKSLSSDGSGIYAENLHTSGNTEGVYGFAASTRGTGVYGLAGSGSGATRGVEGVTNSASSGAVGVYGKYGGTTLADAVGVFGESDPEDYYGVGVRGEGGWKGLYGNVTAGGTGVFYGVNGAASSAEGQGAVYGVYGEAVGGTIHYGVYYSGGLGGTSMMKNIVRTDDGPVALYAQLATENWFEDFGSGVIRGGRAVVQVPSDFAKVIVSGVNPELKVFITPNAQIGEWWVEKTSGGFTLHAPQAANASPFDYRVVVKRPGSEDLRLEAAPEGYVDRALYTDASEVPAQYHAEWAKRAAIEAREDER